MNFFKRYIYQIIFSFLICLYIYYSFTVYFAGSGKYNLSSGQKELDGQLIWQQKNCQACHQIYGLGGYMGPDLTNIISDRNKGEQYARIIIQNGTQRMPKFDLSSAEIDKLISYLKQVDGSGKSTVNPEDIDEFGNYNLAEYKNE